MATIGAKHTKPHNNGVLDQSDSMDFGTLLCCMCIENAVIPVMIPLTDDIDINSSQCSKVCKQCKQRKPLRSYVSKNRSCICVICDTCRAVQEVRSRNRRIAERIRKKGEYRSRGWKFKTEPKTIRNEENPPMEYPDHSIPKEEQVSISAPKSEDISPERGLIPTSKWTVLKSDSGLNRSEPVISAHLLFHPLVVKEQHDKQSHSIPHSGTNDAQC